MSTLPEDTLQADEGDLELNGASEAKPDELAAEEQKPEARQNEPVVKPKDPEATLNEDIATHSPPDPLQVAAQVYPWLYMSSTLDACFKTAESSAQNELETKEKELEKEEVELSDQRTRLDAERAISFFDELKFAKDAPDIMQAFLSHGDACTEMESTALDLATRDPDVEAAETSESPMQVYNDALDHLDALLAQAQELKTAIQMLTEEPKPDEQTESQTIESQSQIIPVFAACLPVLSARVGNLTMAQQLLEGAKENFAMTLQLESLEMSDDEGSFSDESHWSYNGEEEEPKSLVD